MQSTATYQTFSLKFDFILLKNHLLTCKNSSLLSSLQFFFHFTSGIAFDHASDVFHTQFKSWANVYFDSESNETFLKVYGLMNCLSFQKTIMKLIISWIFIIELHIPNWHIFGDYYTEDLSFKLWYDWH